MGGFRGFGSILLKEIEERKRKKTSHKRLIPKGESGMDVIDLDETDLNCDHDDCLNDVDPDEIHPDESEEEFSEHED